MITNQPSVELQESVATPSASKTRRAVLWAATLFIWLAVAFSLGWYYTFTYYGRAGWPMPFPEAWASILLYYFSVINAETEVQAVHWMLVFPCAGWLWPYLLRATAARLPTARPDLARLAFALALAAIPVALPGPIMAVLAGHTAEGFAWDRMIAVALRRGFVTPEWWLTPLYVGLGILTFALQIRAYRWYFPLPARTAWMHYPAAAISLAVVSTVFAALASYPLR
ncbi:MAG: hypothetical protein K1Y02_25905, partial [Candidatus Hydrogenedentes bacterium]|nr:hypothetical protein [Candidatus Hydrogenedentota bacterium]